MPVNLDTLKKQFRDGQRAQAIAACEAICAQEPSNREARRLAAMMHALTQDYARSLQLLQGLRDPAKEDADILFNMALCERELKNFRGAQQHFQSLVQAFPTLVDGWAGLAECRFLLGEFEEGMRMADKALQLDARCLPAMVMRGNCLRSLGKVDDALTTYRKANQLQPTAEAHFNMGLAFAATGKFTEALDSFGQALQLQPQASNVLAARGDLLQNLGRLAEAADDYRAALAAAPNDAETLKKATICLLDQGRSEDALDLCHAILAKDPGNLTARLGAEWVLSKQVPLWHIPMMNEPERNQAYFDGLKALVAPDKLVFEIGTGSGLLAMMAAKLGVKKVVTCEAEALVARTARKIVERNGFGGQVTVLAKPSYQVEVGRDLPAKADVLVHEIFSSELLGEFVLPAIEDAKERLLAPGGVLMPGRASIMIALVGGEDLARNVHATESFGFDVRDFNAIYPKKRPLYREDLKPELMSADVAAFDFDFNRDARFPAETKRIDIRATKAGPCFGVIQWIRIEMAEGVFFENHPLAHRVVASWQQTVYGFEEPLALKEGQVVGVSATHDRARPWFSLA